MPVHRIAGEYPSLKAAIAEYEKAGEQIVQVVPWADGWVIITTPGTAALHLVAPYEERSA